MMAHHLAAHSPLTMRPQADAYGCSRLQGLACLTCHEVGLFQGRLGFEKAIVLLEDGCEEFSNIKGLVQMPSLLEAALATQCPLRNFELELKAAYFAK
jgi:hypothetical protein